MLFWTLCKQRLKPLRKQLFSTITWGSHCGQSSWSHKHASEDCSPGCTWAAPSWEDLGQKLTIKWFPNTWPSETEMVTILSHYIWDNLFMNTEDKGQIPQGGTEGPWWAWTLPVFLPWSNSFSQPFPDIVPAKKSPWPSTPITLVSHITWARLQLCATSTPSNTQGQLHSTTGAGVGMWTTHTAALCTCSTFWTWSFLYVFVYISLLST